MSMAPAGKLGLKVLGLGLWGATCYFTANTIASVINNDKPQIVTIWENAKKEFDDYLAINEEGIKADSYSEAKEKLDSIRMDRLYRSYGITPPDTNSSAYEEIMKGTELQEKQLQEIIKYLDSITPGINTAEQSAK